jgi:tetratricopeptide (TPR) repeat protein
MYIDLFVILLVTGLVFAVRKHQRLRHLQKLLRRYNENGDLGVLTAWIEEKQTTARMTDLLDYLLKAEESELAVRVFSSFPPDMFTSRHTRLFACKAFAARGEAEEALAMIEKLLTDYPGDDSIHEIAIGTYLDFHKLAEAKALLLPRMNRKNSGTIFDRHFARLTAAEGHLEEAITLLQKVVTRDYSLYKNTFAPAARRQIYEQYVESQKLLDEFTAKLDNGSIQADT